MGVWRAVGYPLKYRYAVVDGLRIRYVDTGSGRTVVLIHGLGGSIEAWHSTITALRDHYRVIALDLRGFGHSQRPTGPVSLSDFARDVVGVMDYAGVGKASILGFSMGGVVALETYRVYPRRVEGLILADTSPRLRIDSRVLVKAFSSPSSAYQSLRRLTHRVRGDSLSLLADALARNDPEYVGLVAEVLSDADYWSLLPRIRVPVLVIVGEYDVLVPLDVARRMASLIPNARLEVIRGAGHLSKFDDPDAFNSALLSFLSSGG